MGSRQESWAATRRGWLQSRRMVFGVVWSGRFLVLAGLIGVAIDVSNCQAWSESGRSSTKAVATTSPPSPTPSQTMTGSSAHLRATLHHGFTSPLVAWRPDGRELAVVDFMGRTVRLWDARTGSQSGELQGLDGQIDTLTYSPDGARLAAALVVVAKEPTAANLLLWDMTRRTLLKRLVVQTGGRSQSISALAYLPDGARVAVALTRPLRTVLYDLTAAVVTAEISTPGSLGPIQVDPSGQFAAYPSHDVRDGFALKIVRLSDGATVTGDVRHSEQSRALAFDPTGQLIAVGDADGGVSVYDARSGRRERRLEGHTRIVWSVRYMPRADRLVSASSDGVRVWNAKTGAQVNHCGLAGPFHRVVLSPGADLVVTGGIDELRVWDVCVEPTDRRR